MEFTPIHCPICGQATFDMEACEVADCPHLAFPLYVAMEVTCGGRACRPIWHTDIMDLTMER